MGLCTKALINEILCEETVILTHLHRGVVIGDIAVPNGSKLSGQTSIHALKCAFLFHQGLFSIKIAFFVQEELLLTTPNGKCFPLEFGFLLEKISPLMSCYEINCLESKISDLDCRLNLLDGSNRLTVNCDGTFDQCLRIKAHVTVLRERLLRISLCRCSEHTHEKWRRW